MITLLSRLFIGKNPDFNQGAVRIAFGKLCSILGIVLNILLFALKLVIGIFAGAISVLADAYNNLSDALSSVLGLLGIKLAAKKPSDERPFGHGRTEYVAGLVIAHFDISFDHIEQIIVFTLVGAASRHLRFEHHDDMVVLV